MKKLFVPSYKNGELYIPWTVLGVITVLVVAMLVKVFTIMTANVAMSLLCMFVGGFLTGAVCASHVIYRRVERNRNLLYMRTGQKW